MPRLSKSLATEVMRKCAPFIYNLFTCISLKSQQTFVLYTLKKCLLVDDNQSDDDLKIFIDEKIEWI